MAADGRAGILDAIKNPLGFFSLAMVIIEGIFGLVVTKSKMSGDQQFVAFCVMAGLFVLVVIVVAVMAVRWPKSLLAKVASELEQGRLAAEFLQSPAFKDMVTKHVVETVKPEAVK